MDPAGKAANRRPSAGGGRRAVSSHVVITPETSSAYCRFAALAATSAAISAFNATNSAMWKATRSPGDTSSLGAMGGGGARSSGMPCMDNAPSTGQWILSIAISSRPLAAPPPRSGSVDAPGDSLGPMHQAVAVATHARESASPIAWCHGGWIRHPHREPTWPHLPRCRTGRCVPPTCLVCEFVHRKHARDPGQDHRAGEAVRAASVRIRLRRETAAGRPRRPGRGTAPARRRRSSDPGAREPRAGVRPWSIWARGQAGALSSSGRAETLGLQGRVIDPFPWDAM